VPAYREEQPTSTPVTLATDQAVTELLFAAKTNLKKADPNSAVHKVYFNPDLSPQEAQKAYLRRQDRRLKNGGPNHVNSPLNALAPPFPATV